MRFKNLDLWGYPLVFRTDGRRIRKRLLKKLIQRWLTRHHYDRTTFFLYPRWKKDAAHYKIGDLFRVCSQEWNSQFQGIQDPIYAKVGAKTFVLMDADIEGSLGGNCSLRHCLIDPPYAPEEIPARQAERVRWHKEYGWGNPAEISAQYADLKLDARGIPIEETTKTSV